MVSDKGGWCYRRCRKKPKTENRCGGRAPLNYLLERDMLRRPFPFPAGEDILTRTHAQIQKPPEFLTSARGKIHPRQLELLKEPDDGTSVFGFRFSPFRFPSLGPTQGSWPVRVSCVETCTQFAFHRPCTPRHARVRAHGNVFGPR